MLSIGCHEPVLRFSMLIYRALDYGWRYRKWMRMNLRRNKDLFENKSQNDCDFHKYSPDVRPKILLGEHFL